MKRFKKYEFASKGQADQSIDGLGFETFDGRKYPTHNNDIVRLGHLVTTHGTYDEDGKQITAPIFSNKYSLDVLWDDTKDVGWAGKRIQLNGRTSSHSFAGHDYSDGTV